MFGKPEYDGDGRANAIGGLGEVMSLAGAENILDRHAALLKAGHDLLGLDHCPLDVDVAAC